MAYCFMFTDRKTGDPVSPAAIDDAIRLETKQAPDPKEFSWEYQSLSFLAMACLDRATDTVTRESFDAYRATDPERYAPEDWALFERYLVTDYKYSAWSGR